MHSEALRQWVASFMVISLWHGMGVEYVLRYQPRLRTAGIPRNEDGKGFDIVLAFFLVSLIIYMVMYFMGWFF